MAEFDIQKLAQALADDSDLRADLEAATSREDVVRIVNERGIALSVDDLTAKNGELSPFELEAVSGGSTTIMQYTMNPMCYV